MLFNDSFAVLNVEMNGKQVTEYIYIKSLMFLPQIERLEIKQAINYFHYISAFF